MAALAETYPGIVRGALQRFEGLFSPVEYSLTGNEKYLVFADLVGDMPGTEGLTRIGKLTLAAQTPEKAGGNPLRVFEMRPLFDSAGNLTGLDGNRMFAWYRSKEGKRYMLVYKVKEKHPQIATISKIYTFNPENLKRKVIPVGQFDVTLPSRFPRDIDWLKTFARYTMEQPSSASLSVESIARQPLIGATYLATHKKRGFI